MAEDAQKEIYDIVRPLFPPQALVTFVEHDRRLVFTASWRMGSNRMDNWSREIHLIIPASVTERFGKLNEKGKFKANANLVSYIRLKLDGFRPEHDRPRYLLPPADVWEVKYEDIFPK